MSTRKWDSGWASTVFSRLVNDSTHTGYTVWTGFIPDDPEPNWQTQCLFWWTQTWRCHLLAPGHWVYYLMSFCFFICKNPHGELQRVSAGKYIKCLLTVGGMLQPLPFLTHNAPVSLTTTVKPISVWLLQTKNIFCGNVPEHEDRGLQHPAYGKTLDIKED